MAMKLHDFLQKVIFFSGKTQVQAANEAKICPPTFNALCTGKREINPEYAARLENVFGIQPDTALIDKIFKELILFTARAA